MYCRYCGKRIPDDLDTCVSCGKENVFMDVVEQKTKQKKTIKIVAIVLAAAILLGALAYGIVCLVKHIQWLNRPEDLFYHSNYTVSAEKMAATKDTVVATAGDRTLTNAQLQVFYWMCVYEFLDTNGSNLSYYQFNYTAPFHSQTYDKETGKTWQQYFLENALYVWHRYAVINEAAEAAGFQLPEAAQKELDGIDESVKKAAEEAKAESVDAFLQSEMGPCVTLDNYKYYLNMHYIASTYLASVADKMKEDMTSEEIEAWYEENEATLKSDYGVTKELGDMVSVRHILITVEKSGKDQNDKAIATDEDWEKCKAEAQRILDEFNKGEKTESEFGELAEEHSEDGGSNENGGLYTGITKNTNFVEPFLNWCMDESREVGDTDLVKTDYGYHIMYFVEGKPAWEHYSRLCAVNDKCTETVDDWMEETVQEVDYTELVIGEFSIPS